MIRNTFVSSVVVFGLLQACASTPTRTGDGVVAQADPPHDAKPVGTELVKPDQPESAIVEVAKTEPAKADVAERLPQPLVAEQQALFLGSPEDKPAKYLMGVGQDQIGRHYVTGNEWNLQLLYPAVKDLGGAYVGVGSDQAYLFIGWQKPEVAFLSDYDPWIADVHKLYQAFFLYAETPADFRKLWELDNKAEADKAFVARYPNDPKIVARMHQLLFSYRKKIIKRLDRVKETFDTAKVPSFLNDAAMYTWVREFVRVGRARPMVGDLLAPTGIIGISQAAEKMGIPIRVLYVSNAEQYWGSYSAQFRKNIARVFHDDKSLLVRTLLTWERNQDYRYNVQPMDNFIAWIGKPWVLGVKTMIHARTDASRDPEFFRFEQDPALNPPRTGAAKKP